MKYALVCLCCLISAAASATELKIAVAANFLKTMEMLSERFSEESGNTVRLSAGSTGKLYAQIINGAPYDLFFAADRARPEKLEAEGYAIPGSRFSYAMGRLVLWSPDTKAIQAAPPHFDVLGAGFFAIANPDLAPYGAAARETLIELGVWDGLQGRLVRGENINQALQFVHSGNARLGLVGRSQLQSSGLLATGSSWPVPQSSHAPIEQQAVVINDLPHAHAFAAYIQSAAARDLIRENGYDLPRQAFVANKDNSDNRANN